VRRTRWRVEKGERSVEDSCANAGLATKISLMPPGSRTMSCPMPNSIAEPLTPEFGAKSRQVLRSTTVATEGSGRRGMWRIKRVPVGSGQVDRRDGSDQYPLPCPHAGRGRCGTVGSRDTGAHCVDKYSDKVLDLQHGVLVHGIVEEHCAN